MSGRLAGALVHDPKLIILDEPSTGLDAGSARTIKGVSEGASKPGLRDHDGQHPGRRRALGPRIGVMAGGALIAEGYVGCVALPGRVHIACCHRCRALSPIGWAGHKGRGSAFSPSLSGDPTVSSRAGRPPAGGQLAMTNASRFIALIPGTNQGHRPSLATASRSSVIRYEIAP